MADLFANASKNEDYDASNIEVLEGLEPVRALRGGAGTGRAEGSSEPELRAGKL